MIISTLGWCIIFVILIGIAMIVSIEINKKPVKQKPEENHACFKCGQTNNITRVAFVDANDNIISYVISCRSCLNDITDKRIKITLRDMNDNEAFVINEQGGK